MKPLVRALRRPDDARNQSEKKSAFRTRVKQNYDYPTILEAIDPDQHVSARLRRLDQIEFVIATDVVRTSFLNPHAGKRRQRPSRCCQRTIVDIDRDMGRNSYWPIAYGGAGGLAGGAPAFPDGQSALNLAISQKLDRLGNGTAEG
jgi:hypothetical protein